MSEYTHCASFDDFKKHGKSQDPAGPLLSNGAESGAVGALIGGAIGAALGILAGVAFPLALLGALWGFSYGFVSGFCDQWLNWRLVCVDAEEQCAGGQVAWIEHVTDKFSHGTFDGPIEYLFDNDLSFNLRLTPYNGHEETAAGNTFEFPVGGGHEYGLAEIEKDPFPSAELLRSPHKPDGTAWGLSYEGYEGTGKPNNPGGRWTQHCEIEGNGMSVLCTIGKVLAALYPLGVVVGVVVGAIGGAVVGAVEGWNAVWSSCRNACGIPVLCDIACFVAALAAAIVGAIVGLVLGAIAGVIPGFGQVIAGALISVPFRHNGEFSDVANDPDSGRIEVDDPVFVSGMHVYDAGHPEGWTEIHPVRHLQKIPEGAMPAMPAKLTGDPGFRQEPFVGEVKTFWDTWCRMVKEGKRPEVKSKQDKLVNRWCVHPELDGCAPVPVKGEGGEVIA